MAIAFRRHGEPRAFYVRFDRAIKFPVGPTNLYLTINMISHEVAASYLGNSNFAVETLFFSVEDALVEFEGQYMHVSTSDPNMADAKGFEKLAFHQSFFVPYFDFARGSDIYVVPGRYAKPGSLAIFTHVYNDNEMLTVWVDYYRRIVPLKCLYVIDHGSTSGPKEILPPEINVIVAPRGNLDHRAIAQFCSAFQRFLLAQFRWVMHVDADEILIHRMGHDHICNGLIDRDAGVILRPGRAFHLVHDIATESAIDLSSPISLQRSRLVPAPRYEKPVLASVPTTWGVGFHVALEQHAIVVEDDLWLIHLAYADHGLYLAKNLKWSSLEPSEMERMHVAYTETAAGRASADKVTDYLSSLLSSPEPEPCFPDWMRGMF